VVEVTDDGGRPELITNGDFESDTTGWEIYIGDGSDGAMITSDAALNIEFTNYAGWNKWSTQIYQEEIVLASDVTYELSFDISSTEERDVWLEMNFLDANTLSLTDVTTTYTYALTATSDITDGKLNFLLGTDNLDGGSFTGGQSVTIDHISIEMK
jgi:hypothetical protein